MDEHEIHIQFWFVNSAASDYLEDLEVDAMLLLQQTVRKEEVKGVVPS